VTSPNYGHVWRQQQRKNNDSHDIGNQHKTQIKNVLYVDGLKHNLLSISQLCDKGFKIEFNRN